MKKRKFLSVVMLMLGVMFVMPKLVWAIPAPTPAGYVNDFAEVLSEETRQYIIDRGVALAEISDAQVVVTTVNFTDGLGVEDYGIQMFNEWGIGDAQANNGILILLAIQEDDFFVVRGDGIPAIMSDGALDGILMNVLNPAFDSLDFDAGAKQTFSDIMDRVSNHYVELNSIMPTPRVAETTEPFTTTTTTITTTEDFIATQNNNMSGGAIRGGDIVAIIFIVVILLVFLNVMSAGRRRRMGMMPMGGGMGSSMFWWFMPSPFQRRRRPRGGMGMGGGMRNNTTRVTRTTTTTTRTPSGPTYRGGGGFGGGGRAGGGMGRGGAGRMGGGGRAGGGVGRRR